MARFAFSYYSMAAAALGLTALASPVQAQERSAMGNTEVQMTWSSLTNLVAAANNRAAAVESRMNQMIICNKKFKLYAPGYPGADGDGCIENALIKQLTVRMDKAEKDITDTNTKLTALDTKVTQNLARIDGNVAALSVKIDGLTGRMGVAEGDIRNLNTKVEDLNVEVALLNTRIENVYAALDVRITAVDKRVTAVDKRVTTEVATINTRVTNEVAAINQRIATINGQIADLYNRTNDLYNKTAELDAKTKTLETAVNAIRQCGAQKKLTNTANQCVSLPAADAANCTVVSASVRNGACPAGYGGYIQTGTQQASNSSQSSWGTTTELGYCFKAVCN